LNKHQLTVSDVKSRGIQICLYEPVADPGLNCKGVYNTFCVAYLQKQHFSFCFNLSEA